MPLRAQCLPIDIHASLSVSLTPIWLWSWWVDEHVLMPLFEGPRFTFDHKFQNLLHAEQKCFQYQTDTFFSLWPCEVRCITCHYDESQRGPQLSHHVLFLQLFTWVWWIWRRNPCDKPTAAASPEWLLMQSAHLHGRVMWAVKTNPWWWTHDRVTGKQCLEVLLYRQATWMKTFV